jgi:aminoglycoside phosphotransferase (APT) family kinase protein
VTLSREKLANDNRVEPLTNDMERANARILARRQASKTLPPYRAALIDEIAEVLRSFFALKRPDAEISGVRRVGGGASKEQFFFTLRDQAGEEQFLLRMDPRRAITETDRAREFTLLQAMSGIVPVPQAAWVDNEAKHFPQPAAIMRVVEGVTKPSDAGMKVSGLGTWLGDRLRAKLKDQFLDHLVAIHGFDFRARPLTGFEVPDADPHQAARWSFNYWREMWRVDDGQARPVISLAEQWLADNMPECEELVLTHGDYRTGNYLFEEASGKITALLDWELARIGDFHEDLAWVLMQVFGTFDPNGTFRASDLFEREEFIVAYEARSGRKVNRKTLHYYDVMSSWKCYIIVAANGLAAARSQHNHQDVLLTFLAATAPMFAADLVRLLSQGEQA